MKLFNALIIVLMFGAGWWLAPQLPAMVPMHWNIQGQVDNYWPKEKAVWFLPILTLVMWGLFAVLPHLDPKKENYLKFAKEWKIMQAVIIGFMAYMYLVTMYITLNPGVEIMPFVFTGLGLLFIVIGKCLPGVKHNYFVGIKTPWTLADEKNWDKTHQFAGWCFMGAGAVTLAEAVLDWWAPVVVFGSLILAAILPVGYSLWIFKKGRKFA
jgi:uncharacterized membrane protein